MVINILKYEKFQIVCNFKSHARRNFSVQELTMLWWFFVFLSLFKLFVTQKSKPPSSADNKTQILLKFISPEVVQLLFLFWED